MISSHRLALVEVVCDRVAIIHQGLILDIDTPQSIMAKTNTTSLEDAYLSIIPGYQSPVFLSDGSVVEGEKQEELSEIKGNPEQKSDI